MTHGWQWILIHGHAYRWTEQTWKMILFLRFQLSISLRKDFIFQNKFQDLSSKLAYLCNSPKDKKNVGRWAKRDCMLKGKRTMSFFDLFFLWWYLIKCQSLDQYIHCKWDKDTSYMIWWMVLWHSWNFIVTQMKFNGLSHE